MLLNRIPELNLRYALGEVALIFIGVTAAFVFDQFKEERSMMAEERAVLSEIVEDLRATKIDLISDIERSEKQLAAQVELMSAVQSNDIVLVDKANFRVMFSGSRLYPKVSGYLALQNAGLGLVSDRQIRASLTDFFELRLPRVRAIEELMDRHMRALLEILRGHLIVRWNLTSADSALNSLRNVRANSIGLRDAQALLNQPELTITLHIVYSSSKASLYNYEEALLDIGNLIEGIERHLEATSR